MWRWKRCHDAEMNWCERSLGKGMPTQERACHPRELVLYLFHTTNCACYLIAPGHLPPVKSPARSLLKAPPSGGRTASQGSWSPFLVAVFFPWQRQWSVVRSSPTSPRGFDAKKRRWSRGFSIVLTSIVGFRKQRGPTLWEGDAEVGGRGGWGYTGAAGWKGSGNWSLF